MAAIEQKIDHCLQYEYLSDLGKCAYTLLAEVRRLRAALEAIQEEARPRDMRDGRAGHIGLAAAYVLATQALKEQP